MSNDIISLRGYVVVVVIIIIVIVLIVVLIIIFIELMSYTWFTEDIIVYIYDII